MELSASQNRGRDAILSLLFLFTFSFPLHHLCTMSRPPHPQGCLCSNCHLSSRLFPRGPNDRIILPAIRPSPGSSGQEQAPKSPYSGNDRARLAPPRPRSTAPHEYQPHRHEPPPPMPAPPRGHGHGYGSGYGEPSSPSTSRRSMDTPHRAAPPMHRPVPTRAHAQPTPDRNYTFAPPDRPASAMAGPSSSQQQQGGQGNLEWMPPRLKWVKKKERVSHFTPPSQYQGTSFRQYVHDGVSTRPNNP
ncbi:hypothetical protein DFH06DRAFT_1481085 [Mycena polygramma]|nr:hypothetical protein DFH06DRAFT_1481085 [Mycena polygramma]